MDPFPIISKLGIPLQGIPELLDGVVVAELIESRADLANVLELYGLTRLLEVPDDVELDFVEFC